MSMPSEQGSLWLAKLSKKSQDIRNLGIAAILLVTCAIAMPGLAVILFFVLLYCFSRPKRPGGSDDSTYGTARWATIEDLEQAGCTHPTHALLVGRVVDCSRRRHDERDVYIPEFRSPHQAIFGPSGSGKSTAVCITNMRTKDAAGCVVIDTKGEIARATAQWRHERLGHEIVIIDPFNVVGKHGFRRGKINPLAIGEDPLELVADDARRLANSLVVRTPGEKEPFWNSSAQVLIQAMIAFLKTSATPEKANLNYLREILTSAEFTDEVLKFMVATDNCFGLLKRMAGQVRQLRGQTAASVFAVANSHLEFLDSVPVANVLSETTFDPRLLLENRMTIYLCLPVDRIMEMRGLQRVLVTSLINFIFQAGESKSRRVRLMLDEAATLGEIDSLYSAIMFGRGFGIRSTLYFQSASQVSVCFPESKAQDFRGTVASVFCGVSDYAGAEEVSKWIGQATVWNQSMQASTSWGTSSSQSTQDIQYGWNDGGGESYSCGQVGRALIQPEELLQLPSAWGVALVPNVRPVLFEKVPYYERRDPTADATPGTTGRTAWWAEHRRSLGWMIVAAVVVIVAVVSMTGR